MKKIDNTVYDPRIGEFQDRQQAQVAACRDFYTDSPPTRVRVREFDEVELPLERSRIYLRKLSIHDLLELVEFRRKLNGLCVTGWDAEGQPYLEY